jgi:hypothetical protein
VGHRFHFTLTEEQACRRRRSAFCRVCEEAHYFALMVGLGFFEAAAHHYRMVVPNDFQPVTLKTTAMHYLGASLTDSDGTKFLFPHRIITTMSIADAEALQKRLIAIDKFNQDNRCDISIRETAAATAIGGIH